MSPLERSSMLLIRVMFAADDQFMFSQGNVLLLRALAFRSPFLFDLPRFLLYEERTLSTFWKLTLIVG
jgi:hypothetical protein